MNVTYKKIRRVGLVALICVAFALYRWYYFAPGIVDRISAVITYPIVYAQQMIKRPIDSISTWFTQKGDLLKQLARLRQERQQLLALLTQIHASTHFAEETSELIDFKKRYYDYDLPFGQVIAHYINRQEAYMLVDRGEAHGITVDMVALYKNCLVGRVSDVYRSYCKVQLITDARCKVAAYCANSKARGIYEGVNDTQSAALKFVSHLQEVVPGDLVISSGQGAVFPQGFLLGAVASAEPDGLSYRIKLEPAVDVSAIEYCYLGHKGQL